MPKKKSITKTEYSLEDAVKDMEDGRHTIVMPFFFSTPRETFIKEVLQRCEWVLRGKEFHRIFLFFQEGITEKKALKVIADITKRAQNNLLLKKPDPNLLKVNSFGNVPYDIIMEFFDNSPRIEIIPNDDE